MLNMFKLMQEVVSLYTVSLRMFKLMQKLVLLNTGPLRMTLNLLNMFSLVNGTTLIRL